MNFSIIPTFKTMFSRYLLFFFCVVVIGAASRAPGVHPEPLELVYPAYFGNRITIPADNPLTREGVYLGRLLFYEPRLSASNKVSCENCHQQRLAFTDGRAASLETQMITPLSSPHEIGQSLERSVEKLRKSRLYPNLFRSAFGSDSIAGDRIVKAIAQFERTLISANSRYDRYLRGELIPDSSESRGMVLFMRSPSPQRDVRGANCEHCHGSPRFFMDQYHNNGLDSLPVDKGREILTGLTTDRGRFRVPTLRNIALTAPYMHDGRFRTLEEVFDHYSEHIRSSASLSPVLQNASNAPVRNSMSPGSGTITDGSGLALTSREKQDLLSFLRMLTDSAFITDPRFSNPHIHDL